jgi:hypothetical protein
MKPTTYKYPGVDERVGTVDKEGVITDQVWVPPRRYMAESVDGLVSMLEDLSDVHEDIRIFVGPEEVVAILGERGHRQDRIIMPLKTCESYHFIKDGVRVTQQEFVFKLRTLYSGNYSPDTLLPTIRSLKLKKTASGTARVEHGSETVDHEIEAMIRGENGDIPDEITLNTPVYKQIAMATPNEKQVIRCALQPNVEDKTFTIQPLEGEVIRAAKGARDRIVMALKNVGLTGAKIYVDAKYN